MIIYVHHYFPTTATFTVRNILSFVGLKEKSGYIECCYNEKAKNEEQLLTKTQQVTAVPGPQVVSR